jgi:hypothetical protein
MLKSELWNKSVPRVELDQRARNARLRLERIGRHLVPRAASTRSPRRRLIYLFTGGIFVCVSRESRTRGPLSSRRPRMLQIRRGWFPSAGRNLGVSNRCRSKPVESTRKPIAA